jgi:hypothetical protein
MDGFSGTTQAPDWLGESILDPAGSGYGPVAGSREYGDEPSGSGSTQSVQLLLYIPNVVKFSWRDSEAKHRTQHSYLAFI